MCASYRFLSREMLQVTGALLIYFCQAFLDGGGGIRTHDNTDTRRTLSKHGYGKSALLLNTSHWAD